MRLSTDLICLVTAVFFTLGIAMPTEKDPTRSSETLRVTPAKDEVTRHFRFLNNITPRDEHLNGNLDSTASSSAKAPPKFKVKCTAPYWSYFYNWWP